MTGAVLLAAVLAAAALAWALHLARRLRQEAAARAGAEARLGGLIDQPLVGVWVVRDERFETVNARFAEIFGTTPGEVAGRVGPLDLVAETDRERLEEALRSWLDGAASRMRDTYTCVRRDGGLVDVEVTGRALVLEGRPAVVGVALDVTERNRIQSQLNQLAFHDAMTRLPNRSLFFDRLGLELARVRRTGERFGLLVLDLDGFKAANDRHGHHAGDEVLRVVARRLRGCVRESDTVARIGGDEFVLLLQDVKGPENASAVAAAVVAAVGEPIETGAAAVRVGASIGICLAPEDGQEMDTLLRRADAAMYESKARGKGCFTRWEPRMHDAEPEGTPFLTWGPELLVGVPAIDEQHARLTDSLNRIARAIGAGQEPEKVKALVEELGALTRHHFETEERLMERIAYHDTPAHRREHRTLVEDLARIERLFDETSLALMLSALRDWLTSHITQGDRELARELLARGAASRPGPRRPADGV